MNARLLTAPFLLSLLLTACASTPRFETEGVSTDVTPQAAARASAGAADQQVLWGGVIVGSRNLRDTTQLEILSYPLTDEQRPNTNQSPRGRFLAVQPGYVETADFAPGRLITVRGRLQERVSGKIGEADYTYPVVAVEDLELWQPQAAAERTGVRPRFNFGIGVMIGR
jgi:outer membrane lipoprotein